MILRFTSILSLVLMGCGGSVTTGTGGGSSTSTSAESDATSATSASVAVSVAGTTTGVSATSSSSTAATGSGGAGATVATSTTSTASTGGGCDPSNCTFNCCNGACVNLDNDILNCGKCGNTCGGQEPYCDKGTCGTPPCEGVGCSDLSFCCGTQCCNPGQLCCTVPGPVGDMTECTAPMNGTCPLGCNACVCASPDTPIATPKGERAIADLAPGDLVYSVDRDASVVVPIRRVAKVAAPNHAVVHVELESGRVLEISPRHPTADGRSFDDLRAGDRLDGVRVVRVELIPYRHAFTYDILPDSDTGEYVAAGVLIGSTLVGKR